MTAMEDRLAKLRELLEEQETFPLDYMHKFIGRNSSAFTQGVAEFEIKVPKARLQSMKPSANQGHLAMTYRLLAVHVDEIIEMIRISSEIPDLLLLL